MPGEEAEKLVAVADASSLIGLCWIGQWELLEAMAQVVYVPAAVWEEVVEQGRGRPGVRELQSGRVARRRDAVDRRTAKALRATLGAGEAEVIALAMELRGAVVLADDPNARKAAQKAGLQTMGVVGFLTLAKTAGHVREIRPLLDALQAHGFRLSRSLVQAALRDAGES